MTKDIAVAFQSDDQYERAQVLSKRLNLEIDNQAQQQLLVMADKLALVIDDFKPLYADFSISTWQKRRDAGKKQGLVRACKPMKGMRIVDATAGWGRDAAVLASFGAAVIMLERQPILATLLEDALDRQDEHSKRVLNLKLQFIDSFDFLHALTESDYPDVVYIDPMHPERQKAALVKKDLQILQQLIARDDRALDLLELAKSKVKNRVVVKWPQHLEPLLKPNITIPGKTVRFDIYFP